MEKDLYLTVIKDYDNGYVRDCSNSSALAMQSCTKLSMERDSLTTADVNTLGSEQNYELAKILQMTVSNSVSGKLLIILLQISLRFLTKG